jgi:hypothetical protein
MGSRHVAQRDHKGHTIVIKQFKWQSPRRLGKFYAEVYDTKVGRCNQGHVHGTRAYDSAYEAGMEAVSYINS